MSKYQDGEYISLVWEYTPETLYVKGHIDPAEAARIIEENEDYAYEIETPVQAYGRWSTEAWISDGCTQGFREYSERGRGRFPVMAAKVIRVRTAEEADAMYDKFREATTNDTDKQG